MGVARARQEFSQLLNDVWQHGHTVVIHKGGVPLAALVPLSTLDRDQESSEERSRRRALVRRLWRHLRLVLSDEMARDPTRLLTARRAVPRDTHNAIEPRSNAKKPRG
jgi:prevent-host-death family protein